MIRLPDHIEGTPARRAVNPGTFFRYAQGTSDIFVAALTLVDGKPARADVRLTVYKTGLVLVCTKKALDAPVIIVEVSDVKRAESQDPRSHGCDVYFKVAAHAEWLDDLDAPPEVIKQHIQHSMMTFYEPDEVSVSGQVGVRSS